MADNEVNISAFLNRLQTLQALCSSDNPKFPVSLLLCCGQDGRNNKGSIAVLKYLFLDSTGKDLLESTVDMEFEALEELVLLVQENSLSVIWTHEMKSKVGPYINACPCLHEYISHRSEEEEIDALQARKCCDFKRMMIESVGRGGGVGVPIPIGYENIQDIETWPLLQSFAMDSVFCPTGFFTSYFTVIDVTEFLEIMFRSVDDVCVDRCVGITKRTILPHALQTIRMLDSETAEQRSLITADDALGPLSMLYEFSELDCALPADPNLRPVLLFGEDSEALGLPQAQLPRGWQDRPAGGSLHAVIEGCEPSGGIRWCRTYFLQRGKCLDFLVDSDSLVDYDEDEEKAELSSAFLRDSDEGPLLGGGRPAGGAAKGDTRSGNGGSCSVMPEVAVAVRRFEALYTKLWLGLRAIVREAFSSHSDVLEAATEIQTRMDSVMRSRGGGLALEPSLGLTGTGGAMDVTLGAGERLQVHVDCVDGLGAVVTIEDVDDMGGSCWVYIRVSVHGIEGPTSDSKNTVAVGDTFLFSTATAASLLYRPLLTSPGSQGPGGTDLVIAQDGDVERSLPLLGDSFCLTHPVPYLSFMPGVGAEDRSARRLLACSRNPLVCASLGLGSMIESFGTGLVQVPVLTDHPLLPLIFTTMRPFTGGFVVERMIGSCLPILVSISTHVECVYNIDAAECLQQALALFPPRFGSAVDIIAPDGIVIVFKLKTFGEGEATVAAAGADTIDFFSVKGDLQKSIQYNPLAKCLPATATAAEPRYLALLLETDSRAAAALVSARQDWKVAMRMYDVPDYRGAGRKIPAPILRAFLTAIDCISYGVKDAVDNIDPIKGESSSSGSDEAALTASHMLAAVTGSSSIAHRSSVVGNGYFPMRSLHALSETQRLLAAKSRARAGGSQSAAAPAEEKANADGSSTGGSSSRQPARQRHVIVVLGHAGSGALALGSQLGARLSLAVRSDINLREEGIKVCSVTVDLAAEAAGMNTTDLDIRDIGDMRVALNEFTRRVHSEIAAAISLLEVADRVTDEEPSAGGGRQAHSVLDGGEVVVAVVIAAGKYQVGTTELVAQLLREFGPLGASLVSVISVLNAASLFLDDATMPSYSATVTEAGSLKIAAVASSEKPTSAPQSPSPAVGEESWRAGGLTLCQAALCDVAVVIEPAGLARGFSSVKRWLASTHSLAEPATNVLRVPPGLLRLDDDAFEQLLDSVKASLKSARRSGCLGLLDRPTLITRTGLGLQGSEGERVVGVMSGSGSGRLLVRGSNSIQPSSSGGLTVGAASLQVAPPRSPSGDRNLWCLSSLVIALQTLFPSAAVSAMSEDETWVEPPPGAELSSAHKAGFSSRGGGLAGHGSVSPEGSTVGTFGTGLGRAGPWYRTVFLSKVKVMSSRQVGAALAHCQAHLQQLIVEQRKNLQLARKAVMSVHGYVAVRQHGNTTAGPALAQACKWVSVEACTGAIIIRSVEDAPTISMLAAQRHSVSASAELDALTVQGLFSSTGPVADVVRRIFSYCGVMRLQAKAFVSSSTERATADLLAIQKKYGHDDLPSGWWYDGITYLDIEGNRREVRPDISQILEKYVAEENVKIQAYNDLLAEVEDYI